MEAVTGIDKRFRHSAEEIAWVREKCEQHKGTNLTAKAINEIGIASEYERVFNRKMKDVSMAHWFKMVMYPELKKRYYERKKEGMRKFRVGDKTYKEPAPKKSERQENEIFQKSKFIVYVNRRVCGFETAEDLEKFIKENRVLSEDVRVFKQLPVKIEFSVQIG